MTPSHARMLRVLVDDEGLDEVAAELERVREERRRRRATVSAVERARRAAVVTPPDAIAVARARKIAR